MLPHDLTDRTCLDRFAEVSVDESRTMLGGGAGCLAFPVSDADRRSWEQKLLINPPRLAPTSEFDRDLQCRVRAFLAGRHYQALRRLRIEVKDGTVVLSGALPTFHQRQIALECARHVAGVLRVIDRLDVSDPPTEHQLRERNES
ncbi:MAG: BON domain-containing protein [Planctomycetia bacterium]|nr:BON domain-containing protein [Planctomycetia bacterium]